MAHAADFRAAPSADFGHAETTIGKLRLAFRRYAAYRRTTNELNRLSNRDLDDLGISRADIPLVAAESADLITRP